jgi:hypothetical protein
LALPAALAAARPVTDAAREVPMRTVTQRATFLGLALALLCAALPARGDGTQTTTSPVSPATDHVAIQGYDVVAYFTEGKPVKGSADISLPFDDATWQFANASHKAMFSADPDRYMPQYDGSCASGIAMGVSVPANPNNWVIVDGKLYMIAGTAADLESWKRNAVENIKQADEHWKHWKLMLGQ